MILELSFATYVAYAKDALIIIGAPVIRSVAGWLAKATDDGKITRFEKKKLVETVFRVGTMSAMAYFGLTLAGIDNAAMGAAVGAFFADKYFKALKETKPVRR